METAFKTFILVAIDAAVVWSIASRLPRSRFTSFKWPLVLAAALAWGLFSAILIWGFWGMYYSRFFPEWARWSAPLVAVEYGLIALLIWWLAGKLPGNPFANVCLLGGLESIPEHLYGIYGLGIMSTPALQGQNETGIIVFAVFEYVLYWSAVVGLALLIQRFLTRRKQMPAGST